MFLCESWPAERGLAEEPFAALGVFFDGRRDDLDRDDPLQERILGPIHHSHATLAELFEEQIAADCRHGTEGQAVGFAGSARAGRPYRSPDDNSRLWRSTS